MKHILNNLSQEEKNSILEQHEGGMKVMTENFSKLLNSKLGDVKPINEQNPQTTGGAKVPQPTVNPRLTELVAILKKYTPAEIQQAQQAIKMGPSPTKVAKPSVQPTKQGVRPTTPSAGYPTDDGGGF